MAVKVPIVGNGLTIGIYGAVASGKSFFCKMLDLVIPSNKDSVVDCSITTSGQNRNTTAFTKLIETTDMKLIESTENKEAIKNMRIHETKTGETELAEMKKIEEFEIYCGVSKSFGSELYKMGINVSWYDFIGGNDRIKHFADLANKGLREKLPQLDMLIYVINAAESLDAGSTQTMIEKLANDIDTLNPDMMVIFVINKIDLVEDSRIADLEYFIKNTVTGWIRNRIKHFHFVKLSAKYAHLFGYVSSKKKLPSNENDIKDLATYVFGRKAFTKEKLLDEICNSETDYEETTGYSGLQSLFKEFVLDRINVILGRAIVHRMKLADYNNIENLDLILDSFKKMMNYDIETPTGFLTLAIKDNINKCTREIKTMETKMNELKIKDIKEYEKTKSTEVKIISTNIITLKEMLTENKKVLDKFSDIKELREKTKELYILFLKKISVIENDYLMKWIDTTESCSIVDEELINDIIRDHFDNNKHGEIYKTNPTHLQVTGNIMNKYLKNNGQDNTEVIRAYLSHLVVADCESGLENQLFSNNKLYSSGVFEAVIRECCKEFPDARQYILFVRYGESHTIERSEIIAYSQPAKGGTIPKYVDQTMPFLKGIFAPKVIF